MDEVRKVALLGSTGSIGRQTLEVIAHHSDMLKVFALSCGRNYSLLREQVQKFQPEVVHIAEKEHYPRLKEEFPTKRILVGYEGLLEIASHPQVDTVVVAIPSAEAIEPTLLALQRGKRVALAAKEVLVCAGELVMSQGGELLPVDSEHSALFQVLQGERKEDVRRLILTASGGPFLHLPQERFPLVTPEEALKHPTWRMGRKVTIDSATLFNKGLEIIEAMWLFSLPPERIEVVIHPQSIVHSLVEFRDGSLKAQLSHPDMRLPIQYALLFPRRLPSLVPVLQLTSLRLEFQPLDEGRFPAVRLCKEIAKKGGTYPAVLCGADEVAVEMFLQRKIRFNEIPSIVEEVLAKHRGKEHPTLNEVLEAYTWAKEEVLNICS